MRVGLEYDVPVYTTRRFKYIRISDLLELDRPQLERWIYGHFQPLIQGEKGTIIDAIFLQDYERYIKGEKSPLTTDEVYAILGT